MSPTVECAYCGAPLEREAFDVRTRDRHFCDVECKSFWQADSSEWSRTQSNATPPDLSKPRDRVELDPCVMESDLFNVLRDGPRTSAELWGMDIPPKPSLTSADGKRALRDIVCRIRPSKRAYERVYYLYGDERRAARRFVEENRDSLSRLTNVAGSFHGTIDASMLRLIQEELSIARHHTVDDDDPREEVVA